jgi:uncharacterized protein YecE (DUF72 family)
MQVFVGTSGWFYDWNLERSLDWYIKYSNLNAVELNASFYRFPFPNQIKGWAKKGKSLRWVVKVNRLITHRYRFKDCLDIWKDFRDRFEPLDKLIDFYLFQVPPSFKDCDLVLEFAKEIKIGKRFALEIRNKEWLKSEDSFEKLKKRVVLVSVDSPDFYSKIIESEIIYLRMHGRESWYRYNYSREELKEIVDKIKKIKPKKVYIFFNNNHDMLENARLMRSLF